MNDFTELENELKKLRPVRPSAELFSRIEDGLTKPADERIIRPERFQLNWAAVGLGLAAAAVFLLFVRVNLENRKSGHEKIANVIPAPRSSPILRAQEGSASSLDRFVPADATRVVYNKRNEGLQYRSDSEQPLRRLTYQTQQTLEWRNPATGASLSVSYPSKEIVLVPVSGQ